MFPGEWSPVAVVSSIGDSMSIFTITISKWLMSISNGVMILSACFTGPQGSEMHQ